MKPILRFEIIGAHDDADAVNVYSPSYNDGEFIRAYPNQMAAVAACVREARFICGAQAIVDFGDGAALPSITIVQNEANHAV